MSILERMTRRSSLVNRMAETVGVDMGEEMIRGHVTPEEIRGAVFRCMSCRKDGACTHWMDAQTGTAEAAPDYCRNSRMLGRLTRA